MSKRKRELTQRLEELFSAPAGPEESAEAVSTPGAGLAQLVRVLATQNDPAFLATLLDHIPLPIYIKDREHKWIAVNPSFAQLLKRTADQLIGHADKEQSDDDWQHDDRVLESGQPEETEATTAQPAGAPAIRQVTRLPLLNAAGVAEFMIGIIRPAGSPPVQPEPNQLGSVLQSLVEGYYEVDPAGSFVAFNQAVCDIFGYPADELLGLNNRQYTDPETAKLLYATYNRVYQTGEPAKGFGWPIIRKDGTTRYVEASMSLVHDRDGKPIGFRGIVRDITERKLVEGQVLQRNMQLAALNRISQELAQLAEPSEICELLYNEIGQILDNRNLYVALYDEATNVISFPVYTIEGERRPNPSRPFGSGLTEYLIRTKTPLFIPREAAAEIQKLGIAISGRNAQCWMGAPLLVGDKAIGAIALQDYQTADAFTSDQFELLTTIAAQAAIALENARLFTQTQQELSERKQTEEAVRRRADQLAALNRVGRQLVELKPIDEILETVYQSIGEVIDHRNFYIALYDEVNRQIHYPVYSFDDVRSEPHSRAYGKALTEHILETKQPLLISRDVASYLSRIGIDSVGRPAQCWMGVPLLVGNRAIGVIALQDYERANIYTQADVELLTLVASQAAIALQNARLFEQTRNAQATAESRLRESQILQTFSQTVSTTFDVDQVLDALIQVLKQQMGFTFIAISLIDREAGLLRTARAIGATTMQGMTRPLEAVQNDITMDIANKGQTEVIDGWDERLDRVIFEREGHAQLVRAFVPLMLRGQSIGIMEAGYLREKRAQILPEEIRLLQALANSMSVALENSRLFEQTRGRADELSVLNELAQRLSARLGTDQVLDETYQGVKRLMDAENFYIGLYDQPKHQISFMLNVTQFEADREITTISADDGISGYIVRNRTSVLVSNGTNQWAQKMGVHTVGQNALSWLGVPMIVGDQVLGVMAVQSYEKASAYSEHDRELLLVFANQAATAIQNALFFERTQRDAQRDRTIAEAVDRIHQPTDLDAVLQVAVEEISRIVGTRDVRIRLGGDASAGDGNGRHNDHA